jgi:zinc protease
MRTSLALIPLLAVVGTTAHAKAPLPPPAPTPTQVTSVEGITEYALPNGLRVLLFPDQSKPTVTVNVTYFVGSRHEGLGESGMAHLLEHMVFKGTPTHPKIWEALQAHGARFNGTTWVDRTNYFETMAATPENLKFALELEADRMVHSKIADEDLKKEFSVVRNEFERGESNPGRVLDERVLASAYVWHNYGKSTIGSKSDIERVPVENLRAFYKNWYQPDNAMLVVAGKFDVKQALALIGETFGRIPRPARKLPSTYTVEPVQDGERAVTLRRAGDTGVVELGFHGVAGADPRFTAGEALVDALTNRPSGRLYKALVDKGLAARVWGESYAWHDPGMVLLFAQVNGGKEEQLVKLRDAMIGVLDNISKQPITDDEVKRWRTAALADIELAMTDPSRIGVELSEWAAMGDWRMLFVHRDRIEKTTAADVNAFAKEFLKASNRTVGMFVPTAAPDRAPLAEAVDVAPVVRGYKGRAPVQEGEAFAATIENIEKRTERLALPNGMKVALLPKRTRGAAVRMVLRVHTGDEKALAGKAQDAAMLVPSLLLRGTKTKSYQQLRDELDRLKADLRRVEGETGGGGLRVTTTRENLPQVIALLGEIAREPALSATEFETLKKEMAAMIEQQLQDPQALGATVLMQKPQPYPPTDVRYVPTPAERLARLKVVTRDDVAAYWQKHWGGSDAEVAVVGDFDAAEVKKLLAKTFGDWKSPTRHQRIVRTYIDKVPGLLDNVKTPDKPMAFVGAAHAIPLRDDDPDFAAARILNYVLGGSARSRLLDRLRQKEGLSYGAFSMISADPLDRVGSVFAGAICAKENADKAMAALLEEIEKLRKEGVSAAELAEAKKGYFSEWDTQLANDDFVAVQLARLDYLGRTFDYYKTLHERIAKLTPADVGAAARKLLDPSRLIRVRAGDLQ